jgi:hypothetical protein
MCYIKYCQCAAIAKLQNVLKVVHHSGSWICGCSQALMIGGLPLKSAYERPGLLVSSIRPVYANLALAPSSHSVAVDQGAAIRCKEVRPCHLPAVDTGFICLCLRQICVVLLQLQCLLRHKCFHFLRMNC